MTTDKSNRTVKRLLLGALFVGGMFVVVILFFNHEVRRQSIRLTRLDLEGILTLWIREGRPEGEALQEFMKTNNYSSAHFLVSNISCTIDGTNLETKFAKLAMSGTLFVTTNKVIVLMEGSRPPRIVQK
jgi:hypothetical protein